MNSESEHDFESALYSQFAKHHKKLNDEAFINTLNTRLQYENKKNKIYYTTIFILLFINILIFSKFFLIIFLSTLQENILTITPNFNMSILSIMYGIALITYLPYRYIFNTQ